MLARRRIVSLRSYAWLLAVLFLLPLQSGAEEKTPLQQELEGKSPRDRLVYLKGMVDEGKGTKEVFFHLGNAYFQTGDPLGASGAFLKAIELDPHYFKAMVNLP